MTLADCSQVVVPPHPSLPSPSKGAGLAADIVQLLLAKLGEYIVPSFTEVGSICINFLCVLCVSLSVRGLC